MAKKYLEVGRKFKLSGLVVRLGASGTVVDIQIDWTATEEYCVNDPSRPGLGYEIGSIIDDDSKLYYDLFLETNTGRLFYDDEHGY